jgi:hypothetical protein
MISELLKKRERLVLSLSCLMQDYREFLKTPTESVSLDNIKYQIDFDMRELKNLDAQIKQSLSQSYASASVSATDLYNKVLAKQNETKPFGVEDLPKYHYSMFQN